MPSAGFLANYEPEMSSIEEIVSDFGLAVALCVCEKESRVGLIPFIYRNVSSSSMKHQRRSEYTDGANLRVDKREGVHRSGSGYEAKSKNEVVHRRMPAVELAKYAPDQRPDYGRARSRH